MSVIIKDTGFGADGWHEAFVPLEEADETATTLDLGADTDPNTLAGKLNGLRMIRVDFPNFADGRGFTIARQLRLMGYTGLLRAKGHVIADQYAMARRSGFDEGEISEDLAKRQPEDQWLFRADWTAHDYQARLRG